MRILVFFLLFIVTRAATAYAQPVVDSISPKRSYSSSINIHGSGLFNVSGVSFGGIPASFFWLVSDRLIVASPSYLGASGLVVVYSPVGNDTIAGFEFMPFPVISSLLPATGEVGTEITMQGTNLPQEGEVLIGSEAMEILHRTDTLITIRLSKPASGDIAFKPTEANSTLTTDKFFHYAGFLPLKTCTGNGMGVQIGNFGAAPYQWQLSTDSGKTFSNLTEGPLYRGVLTNFLSIMQVDSSMEHYHYRCGVGNDTYYNGGVIRFANVWNRFPRSNAWENPDNWSCGRIPDGGMVVEIPAGKQITLSSHVVCKGLLLGAGAYLNIEPGFSITILK
jgi:hypothetical protein